MFFFTFPPEHLQLHLPDPRPILPASGHTKRRGDPGSHPRVADEGPGVTLRTRVGRFAPPQAFPRPLQVFRTGNWGSSSTVGNDCTQYWKTNSTRWTRASSGRHELSGRKSRNSQKWNRRSARYARSKAKAVNHRRSAKASANAR